MKGKSGRFALLTAFLLIIAACSQQSAPTVSQQDDTQLTGLQVGLITRAYEPVSEQADAVVAQAQLDVLGANGLKDGPLSKVGGHLALAYRSYESQQRGLSAQGLDSVPKTVVIDAVAKGSTSQLMSRLKALGLKEAASYGRVVSGQLPTAAIPRAAALGELLSMRPAVALTDVGLVTSEGDKAMRSDLVKRQYNVDGSGVKIGILSDSFDRVNVDCVPSPGQGVVQEDGSRVVSTYEQDIASGDLPEGVEILDDSATCVNEETGEPIPGGLIDEGRAMAQLIHDVAPGSDLAFHTAFTGQAGFATGIIDLDLAGSDVIVDDIIYFAEPMFQDGIITQAVDFVARRGVPYFSSAGNRARRSYEAPFRNSGVPSAIGGDQTGGGKGAVLHDFDPGEGVQPCQLFTLQPGQSFFPVLQWDEPFASASRRSPGSSNDVDMYITDAECNPIGVPFVSADDNIGADPFESIQIINPPTGTPAQLGVAISLFAGEEPGIIKYVNFGPASVELSPPLDAPTSYGHNSARLGRGVGAAFWADTPSFGTTPPELESFSSEGGIPILFNVSGRRLATPEVRKQPDFTAPDGANTTFFFSDTSRDDDDGDGVTETGEAGEFPNFFGTSAAAPHVAAVAGLMLSRRASLSPNRIYRALERTAVNIGPPGFDFASGYGLVDARRAFAFLFGQPR